MVNQAECVAPQFDVAGRLGAPAIALVHGAVVTRKMWLPQLRGLSDGYRVTAPDLPGHGTLSHIPFTFDAAVQGLAEIIRSEVQGPALVAGLSLGGYVSIELAHSHPDLVTGLVLSGCSLNFEGVLGLYLRIVSGLMQRGWLKQSDAQAEQKTRRMFSPALADVAEAQLQAGVYPGALGPSFAEMAGKDFAALLAEYPGPCLILNGERDRASRRGEVRFIATLQQGQAQIVPGAGHACNLDQPEAYNQAVRDFAQSIGWISARKEKGT
jgi:pimeloyl-ACP methyl ester carboxylesterase